MRAGPDLAVHRLLRWLTDDALADAIAGDLAEQRRRRDARPRVGAALWYWRAVVGVLSHIALARGRESMVAQLTTRFGASGQAGEVRQALRALLRTPATTLVVVMTLALGLGLNTAIFSVVHGVLFQPLPFPDPDRVVFIQGQQGDAEPSLFGTSLLDHDDLRERNRTFADIATSAYWTFTVTGTDTPLRLVGVRVSGSFFELLGRRPALGRWVTRADDQGGANEVVVLSHGLWQRMFGGSPDAVGRTLMLNGVPAEVIGVMPAGFRFPAEDVELWVAMREELDTVPRASRFFMTVGRLEDDVTIEAAGQDLRAVTDGLRREYPDAYRDWQPVAAVALPALTEDARPRLWLLFAGVVVVLGVACVNVAALIAARGAARSREFAVRAALGAGRLRIARVMFFESAWLGAAGLIGGLAVAMPAVGWLRTLAPADLPRIDDVTLSWPVLVWAAVAMAAFVALGTLAPLLRLRRLRAADVRAGAATSAGAPASRGRRTLVVMQVAAAFALLVAAGLLVRSFAHVLDVNPGFDPRNVATLRVFLTPPTYRTTESQKQYVEDGVARLAATPGVVAVAAVSQPPFDDQSAGTTLPIALEGESYAPGSNPSVRYRTAAPGYFDAAGMTLLGGRAFTADDREGAPLVLVVNESMAERHWPGQSPVGQRLEFADDRGAGLHTVIGVVNDVATDGLEAREGPVVYAPHRQRSIVFLRWMTFLVRTERAVAAELPSIRASLQSLDPNQPIYAVDTMDAIIARSVAERRFSVTLMAGFGALTLLLAAIGLYGALAQGVAARTRDIGVRLAVGAAPGSVFRQVVGEGARVVAAGLALGVLAAWAISGRVESLLFGVTPLDAPTFGIIATVLALVGLVACALPARRASRVDPVSALRAE